MPEAERAVPAPAGRLFGLLGLRVCGPAQDQCDRYGPQRGGRADDRRQCRRERYDQRRFDRRRRHFRRRGESRSRTSGQLCGLRHPNAAGRQPDLFRDFARTEQQSRRRGSGRLRYDRQAVADQLGFENHAGRLYSRHQFASDGYSGQDPRSFDSVHQWFRPQLRCFAPAARRKFGERRSGTAGGDRRCTGRRDRSGGQRGHRVDHGIEGCVGSGYLRHPRYGRRRADYDQTSAGRPHFGQFFDRASVGVDRQEARFALGFRISRIRTYGRQ